jgi:hypothetical protein
MGKSLHGNPSFLWGWGRRGREKRERERKKKAM